MKRILKVTFLELLFEELTKKFDCAYTRWQKLGTTLNYDNRVKPTYKNATNLLLNLVSRIKLTCLTARGRIRWSRFWNYSTLATKILVHSSKHIKTGWIYRTLNKVGIHPQENATHLLHDTNKYNDQSLAYLLISTKTRDSYIGESSAAYTRFKAEITAGKNSHLSSNAKNPNYSVYLAKRMNKVGFNNFIHIPIRILPNNTVLERKRLERFLIEKTQPNLNARIFKRHRTTRRDEQKQQRHRKLRRHRAREKHKTQHPCNCTRTTGEICGTNCWLLYEWEHQRQTTNLTTYISVDNKGKIRTGLALDLLLQHEEHKKTTIIINQGKNTITNYEILKQDFGDSAISVGKVHTQTRFLDYIQKPTLNTTCVFTLDIKKTNFENHNIVTNIHKLAYQPHKWASFFRKCTQQTLLNLYYRAEAIPNRTTRSKAKERLAQYILKRFGIGNMRNLHCHFKYSQKINKHTIRRMINDCVKHTNVPRQIKRSITESIRITQQNRRNIAQILINNRNTQREYHCIQHPL